MTSLYTDVFQNYYNRIGSNVPIELFAKIAEPSAFGLQSRKEFYAPVRFHVKVTRDGRSVKVDVPVHANENWLEEFTERVAGMISQPKNIILKTVTGMPLTEVPLNRLGNVGHLNIHLANQERPLRLATLPSVPLEYSVNKRQDIRTWYGESLARRLPDIVATALASPATCETLESIDVALMPGGAVEQAIKDHVVASVADWPEFVRVHHMNSPAQSNPELANAVAQSLADKTMNYVRSFAVAYKPQIQSMVRGKMAEKLKGKTFTSLVSTPLSAVAGGEEVDAFKLFRRIVDDAVSSPSLVGSVVNKLFSESNFVSLSLPEERERETKQFYPLSILAQDDLAAGGGHHPWNAHTHHTYLQLKGEYPSHYLARHTSHDMSKDASYVGGDVAKTYAAYHMFSGKHIVPPGLLMKGGKPLAENSVKLEPIAKNHDKRKKKKKEKKHPEKYMEEEYLVPIEWGYKRRSKGKKEKKKEEEEETPSATMAEEYLVPVSATMTERAPPVIPIGRHAVMDDDYLVPIERGHYKGKKGKKGKKKDRPESMGEEYLVPIDRAPPVIPIDNDYLVPIECGHYKGKKGKEEEEEEKSEPMGEEYLVPIERRHSRRRRRGKGKKEEEKEEIMPPASMDEEYLVPIESRAPPVIPIGDSAYAAERMREHLVPYIQQDVGSSDEGDDEFADLPAVKDIFE